MSKASPLTAEEKADLEAQLAELDREIAAAEAGPERLPSESDSFRQRLSSVLSELKNPAIKIGGEAGGAALGQKIGMVGGPIGMAAGGFLGGMAGYEATTRGLGEDPTMRGRLQAGLLGAIPFAPEARLATGAAGQLAKATGKEMAEAGAKMAAYNAGAVLAPAAATGELDKVTPSEVILPAIGGAASGALSKYLSYSSTAGSGVASELGEARASGPSSEAASEVIRKAQNKSRDQDLLNWQAIGGKADPRIVNPTGANKVLQGISDSGDVTKTIQAINTARAGEIARHEIGLPVEAELKLDVFKAREQQLKTVYSDIKALGRTAEKTVDAVEDSRDIMRRSWKAWKEAKDLNRGSTDSLLQAAKDSTAKYETLADKLETIVSKAAVKNPDAKDLADRLIITRPQLAKIAVIESATNVGRNTIDVSVLGNIMQDAPKLLTDNLALIGRVWDIQKNAFVGSSIPISEGSKLFPYIMAAGAGVSSYLMGQPITGSAMAAGAGAMGAKAISGAASKLLTGQGQGISSAIQRKLATPQYGTNVPSNLSLFLAKSGAPAGSNVQSFIDRYRQEQQGLSPSR